MPGISAVKTGIPFSKKGFNFSSYWKTHSIQPATPEQVTLVLKADVGKVITLNWGDGSADVPLTANGHEETHTSAYAAAGTYDVSLSGELRYLREFKLVNNTTMSINLDAFEKTGLNHLELDTLTGSITGTINKFPSSLAYLRLDTIGSAITGSINNLPTGLTLLDLIGHPLITGQLQNLSQYLIDLQIEDCPLVDGNINGFGDDLRTIYLSDLAQTITGTLENLPKKRINTLVLERLGTGISGNIECLDNTEKVYYGTIWYLVIEATTSTDAFTGSFDTLITNNPTGWQTLKLINLGQYVTGKLDNMPAIATNGDFYIVDSGTFTYGGGTLATLGSRVDVKIHCGLDADEFDAFLIEFAARSVSAYYNLFDMAGNNEDRSSASDTAVDALVAEYRNVILNDPQGVTNFDVDLGITPTVTTVGIKIGTNRRFAVSGIDWGDGTIDYIAEYHSANDGVNILHTYSAVGTKNIKIKNAHGLSSIVTSLSGNSNIRGLTGSLDQFADCDYIQRFHLQSAGGAMTGSLNSVASASLTSLSCEGIGSAPTLDLDTLGATATALTNLYLFNVASGNVTGSISSLPTGLTKFILWGVGNAFDIKTGTMPAWAGATITLINAHSSTDVDAFLISWATTAGSGTKTITLTNSRTAASDAAVVTLNGLGKTINTSN